jgi:S-ribosylhomocysteine lyase LuxS involved in autoinducer biosynthesis
MEEYKIINIVSGVARAHITNHNAEIYCSPVSTDTGVFIVSISHPSMANVIEEAINIKGLSSEIAAEYVHCRMHGLAAKLLAKIYP